MFRMPPGALSWRIRSGTPETLAVKAMVPNARAERGRPDGASVTERVSTMSTYNSLLVWRTLARRQGTGLLFVADGTRGTAGRGSEKGV